VLKERLLEIYKSNYMFAIAFEFTRDDQQALDLVQDTYIRIMDKQSHYRKVGSLHGFIKVVMKRIHLNNIRRDDIRDRALDTYSDKYYPHEVDDAINYVYCRQLIKKCRHKEILKYQTLGYTTEDIAEITGINKNTVFSKSRYMRKEMSKHK
jgi:RNA polymerase sigma-70 factor (ECF subfamily)